MIHTVTANKLRCFQLFARVGVLGILFTLLNVVAAMNLTVANQYGMFIYRGLAVD